MERVAFKMFLKPGNVEEYKRRHDELWPELKKLLKDAGISEYSIFLDEETHTLFAYQLLSGDSNSQDLGTNPVVKKWWDYNKDLMEVNEDNSPVSVPLREVFYLK
ncbi:L-rhamnose mutarotase [Saccharicrinis sp. FJH2]|uniref:L-rhamnose mutarotase n=1 Tax=unclassified Saccharicrinis TaxID=2646859 RepID=UPI0035D4BDAA